MLNFKSEKKKRLLNIYEQKFAELAAFQENTIVFQANTNASMKNLETQVGQMALSKIILGILSLVTLRSD